jgi:putative MATE family efflux protein
VSSVRESLSHPPDPSASSLPPPEPSAAADLTQGPIASTLLKFSLPILGSSVLQSLNASVNTAWVGRLLGERALSAGANANSLIFFLLGAVFGLGLAATVLVGQSMGAKDEDQAKRVIGTSLTFFCAVSVTLSGLGVAFAPQVLRAMDTPPDVLPLAAAYLRVIFVALPGMYLYTFVMMALRGAGDAKTPFKFLMLSVALDITLNPLLIRGVGPLPELGIAGAAWATLIAQWTALIALVFALYRRRHPLLLLRSELRYLIPDRTILRALLLKGVPMGLQMVVLSASMIAMISLVNRYGARTTAAYGACFQLWNYIQMPALSVGAAVSSMTAQNVGAGRWDRVTRVAQVGVLYNVVLTGSLVLIVTALSHRAFGVFLGDNPAAIAIAEHIHHVVSWSFVLFGVSFVLSSVVRATGAVVPPLICLFISLWLIRIPFAYALTPRLQAEAVWWSFPLGSASSMLLVMAYYRFGGWREASMLGAGGR